MKALIYCRVSERGSDFSGETSIPMQEQICREWVRQRGGSVAKVVRDEFKSAKDMNRAGLQEIVGDIESGHGEWDTLIVYKLSRLSRSLNDGSWIFALLFKNAKGFASVTENLDFSTPSGRAMLGVLQVFNQFEREQTGENTRNKMISIAQSGGWSPGITPFSYKRRGKRDNVLVIDEREAEIVLDVYKMYAGHYQTMDIIKKYSKELTKRMILAILRNKVYLGTISYNGKEYHGKHQPIISHELWDKVQAKMPMHQFHSRSKSQKYEYLLTGLVHCKCGKLMTPASSDGRRKRYHYYICQDRVTCKERVNAEDIEDAVISKIRKTHISKKEIEAVCAEIEKDMQKTLKTAKPELEQAHVAKRKIDKEKERLWSIMMDGLVHQNNKDDWNGKYARVGEESIRLEERIKELQAKTQIDTSRFDIAKDFAIALNSMTKVFDDKEADYTARRQAVLSLIENVVALGNNLYDIHLAYTAERCVLSPEVASPRSLKSTVRLKVECKPRHVYPARRVA